MKSMTFLLALIGFAPMSHAVDTLSDSSTPAQSRQIEVQDVNAPRAQAPRASATEANRSVMQGKTLEGQPAERLGTSYFQRPQEGRGSVRVMPSINSTMANASSGNSGEARSLDINSDSLETKFAFGLTQDVTLETRFSYGADTVKVGSQTSKRTGLSDFHFKATQLKQESNYEWFYGAELGLSPGRAAVADGSSSGSNRYSGGTQITPMVGFQAESVYDFNFGVQGSFTFRTTRFFDDGTDKSGGHLLNAEAFMERDYTPGTLGLMANLTQKLGDERDQAAVLVPQTALGLGGYADFEINPQLFIPVQVSYTMGLANSAGGVSYSKIDRVNISAGASYYF